MTKDKLKSITNFLYTNASNLSGRKLSYPKDNDNIPKEDYELDRINIGVDADATTYYIRVSFKGSLTWYSVAIPLGKEDEWWNRLKKINDFKRNQITYIVYVD